MNLANFLRRFPNNFSFNCHRFFFILLNFSLRFLPRDNLQLGTSFRGTNRRTEYMSMLVLILNMVSLTTLVAFNVNVITGISLSLSGNPLFNIYTFLVYCLLFLIMAVQALRIIFVICQLNEILLMKKYFDNQDLPQDEAIYEKYLKLFEETSTRKNRKLSAFAFLIFFIFFISKFLLVSYESANRALSYFHLLSFSLLLPSLVFLLTDVYLVLSAVRLFENNFTNKYDKPKIICCTHYKHNRK